MTKARLRMLFDNLIDTATLSLSGGDVAKLPVTNLQSNSKHDRVMRSTHLTNLEINGNWDNNNHFNFLALYRHNLSKLATWQLKKFDAPNRTGNVVYDSGIINAIPTKTLGELDFGIDDIVASVFDDAGLAFSVMFFPQVVARSFSLIINEPDIVNRTYIEAQSAYIGHALEVPVNFNRGHGLEPVDESTQIITDGGSNWTEYGPQYRRMTFKLEWLPALERARWFESVKRVGKRKVIFAAMFPEHGGQLERDYSMAAKLEHNVKFVGHSQAPGYYQNDYTLVEV